MSVKKACLKFVFAEYNQIIICICGFCAISCVASCNNFLPIQIQLWFFFCFHNENFCIQLLSIFVVTLEGPKKTVKASVQECLDKKGKNDPSNSDSYENLVFAIKHVRRKIFLEK